MFTSRGMLPWVSATQKMSVSWNPEQSISRACIFFTSCASLETINGPLKNFRFKCGNGRSEREGGRDGGRDRERERERDRQKKKEPKKESERETGKERERERETKKNNSKEGAHKGGPVTIEGCINDSLAM